MDFSSDISSNPVINIKNALKHYKDIREKRNTLFNSIVNDYDKLLKGQDSKTIEINKIEKANLDISAPLKFLPNSERFEEKVIPNNKLELPSESDIIHGVAFFMANRAKQETMIWFVDKLKKDLNNSLIKASFPLTYSKLIEQDDLRVPEFNSSWQMAISEDFVKMLQNILNSQWLNEKAVHANKLKELENVKLTYNYSQRFISLLNGKNDLRKVFEDLYTQKVIYMDTNNRTSLYRSIEFLYILMNEFYNVDSNQKLKTLTFTDFEKINEEQWSVLLDLVKLKYGKGAYDDLNYIIYKLKSNQKIENVNRHFAHITNAFETIELLAKSSDFESKEEKAAELIEQSVVLLKYFDPDFNSVNNNFNSTKYLQIQQFEDLLKIYKSINKKEFGSAVKRTLDFVNPFVSEKLELEFNENQLSLNYSTKTNNSKLAEYLSKNTTDKLANYSITIPYSKIAEVNLYPNYKINLHKHKIVFYIENEHHVVEDFTINVQNLKEIFSSNKFSSFNSKTITDEQIIDFLNEADDLKRIVQKFVKYKDVNNSTKNVYEYIKFIQFLVDISENPLKSLQPYLVKSSEKNLIKDISKINSNYLNDSGQLLVKTTTFFSDILHARDEHGVYRAINNAAAPPTSYMTNRKYPHTLSLNGYVGGYFGYQSSTSNPSDYKKGMSYGITAPIGITYSTPKWGLFLYPIDLGNIVGHYIWETNRDYVKQRVSLKEVFSPGMNFLYNIQDSPFVLFTGMKLVQIPEYYDENRGYVNSNTFDLIQFNAGFKIDIPFLTIKAWKTKNRFSIK